MAHEEEARLLQAGVRSGLIDPEKGTAALAVFVHLKQMGGSISFRELLIDRGLITKYGMERLDHYIQEGESEEIETVSELGPYELEDVIGEGKYGTVFKAVHVARGEVVALKILAPTLSDDAEALEHFMSEARVCLQLRHPNIVKCIEVASASGLYYMVMELMEGGSARDLLEQSGHRLEVATVLEIAKQVATGLAAIHSAGLVHRDIKPENILLTNDRIAKLSDLGIAHVRGGENDFRKHKAIDFWGTPGYIAPEVIEGRTADPRSDLFSLGATLYHLLIGRPPFQGKSPQATLYLQVTGKPQEIRSIRPDLPGPVGVLAMRLLAREPAERFPDAKTVVDAIELIQSLLERGIQTVSTDAVRSSALLTPPKLGSISPATAEHRDSSSVRRLSSSARRNTQLRGRQQRGTNGRPRRKRD